MTSPPAPATPPSKRRSPWKTTLVVVLLLLALLALLRSCGPWSGGAGGEGGSETDSTRRDSLARLDSLAHLADSLRRADSLARLAEAARHDSLLEAFTGSRADSLRLLDSLRRLDSLAAWRRAQNRRPVPRTDSGPSLLPVPGRLSRLDSLRRATGDSLPPVVFADPAPGVHPAPIDVAVLVLEPGGLPLCGPHPDSLRTCRDLIRITTQRTLWIAGEDTVGNRTAPREMRWKIDPDASRCGPRRALVPREDGRTLCVDAYEYPNDPAHPPRTSVNWEDASSLCAQRGRRLCTRDELQAACEGPEEWAFPYGNAYVPGWCQVVEGKLGRGVGKPACRSWWGAYHLVGNAWEWTSTPAGATYFTFGGTYENGPDVRCGKTSRSFFRQNRYEAVGFRCCEDLPPGN